MVNGQPSRPVTLQRPARAVRRDAVRNYHRILDAAREVLGESGADAGMEEIAARAGVGIGTVYRRFASKDALISELLQLAVEQLMGAAEKALARTDGYGLEELLRAFGQSFADHARYANLFVQRRTEDATVDRIRAALDELTARAIAAGAESIREPETTFYGDRSAGLKDPGGNRWWLACHVEDVSNEEIMRRAKAQREQ